MKTALIIPDCHHPYVDRKAYKLMLHAASSLKIDEVVILGDFADFYSVSAHAKDPRVLQMLNDEVESVNKELDRLDQVFPSAKKVFLEGNHEFRLSRYLQNQAPALFGVTDIRNLFKFDTRPNWRFISYGPNQQHKVLGSKLFARHEPIARTAELTAKKAMANITYGHIHRIQSNYATSMEGQQYVAFSCGWLGDKRKNLIFDYVKSFHDWQLGFALVHVDESTGNFYHQIIPILDNYTCVLNGRGYCVK